MDFCMIIICEDKLNSWALYTALVVMFHIMLPQVAKLSGNSLPPLCLHPEKTLRLDGYLGDYSK